MLLSNFSLNKKKYICIYICRAVVYDVMAPRDQNFEAARSMAKPRKALLKELPASEVKLACSEEHLAEISLSITKWRTLAPFLGLTEAEEEAIARDNPDMSTQRIAMLRKWKAKYGCSATYKKLCKVFRKLDRQDLVEVVCRLLRDGSSSESSSDEEAGMKSDRLHIPKSCVLFGGCACACSGWPDVLAD